MADDWGDFDDNDELDINDLVIPEVHISEPEPAVKPAVKPAAPPENPWNKQKHLSQVLSGSSDVRIQQGTSNLGGASQGDSSQNPTPASYASSVSSPRSAASSGGFPRGKHSAPDSKIVIRGLPSNISEDQVAEFLQQRNISPSEIVLVPPKSTNGIYSAVIQLADADVAQKAVIELDGQRFAGRAVGVRVESMERHGNGGISPVYISSTPSYQGESLGYKDRRSYGSSNFGSPGFSSRSFGGTGNSGGRDTAFGGRDKRFFTASGTASDFSGSSFRGNGHGLTGKDWGASGHTSKDRRRSTSQAEDPTIPQDPPPEGRKKLQLKPRTKPIPAFEVDSRAIDAPSTDRPRFTRTETGGTPQRENELSRTASSSVAGTRRNGLPESSESRVTNSSTLNNGVRAGGASANGASDSAPPLANKFAALSMEESLDD